MMPTSAMSIVPAGLGAGWLAATVARGLSMPACAPVVPPSAGLKPLDWAVIGTYGLGLLAVGWFFSRRNRTAEDYLLGGRSMRASSVGLSLFATLFSTITYISLPGEMIGKGPVILWSMVSIPIAYVVVGYALIPHFMRLRVTSAYEILESRLGLGIRLTGSVMFLATRLLWMALIIHVTSEKVIVSLMGWPQSATPGVAAAIGVITLVYTAMGGLRAVVLTDVIQSLILFAAAAASIVLITVNMGGVGAWWPREWSPNWDHQPVFSTDPTCRVTVIGSIVFMTMWWICTAGSDQMAIQRYLATRDARTARRMFLYSGLSNIFVTTLLGSLGLALLGFFRAHPERLGPGLSLTSGQGADLIFPYYIVHFMPPGITGLVIAGLLAAAMSSLSSGINSACSVISVDFLQRFSRPGAPVREANQVWRIQWIAAASGLAAVLLSSLMGQVTGNTMEVTVRTNHVFVAPLFGLFLLGLFVPFANGLGAACGALAGCVAAVVIAYWDQLTGGPTLSFQWISTVSLAVNLAVGLPVCWLTRKRPQAASAPASPEPR